MAKLTMAR